MKKLILIATIALFATNIFCQDLVKYRYSQNENGEVEAERLTYVLTEFQSEKTFEEKGKHYLLTGFSLQLPPPENLYVALNGLPMYQDDTGEAITKELYISIVERGGFAKMNYTYNNEFLKNPFDVVSLRDGFFEITKNEYNKSFSNNGNNGNNGKN